MAFPHRTPGILVASNGDLEMELAPVAIRAELTVIERLTADAPPSLIRTYQSADQGEAGTAMAAEMRELAKHGYRLVSQSWAAPERPILTGIAGLALLLIGLFFVFGSPFVALVVILVGVVLLGAYSTGAKPGTLSASFEARTGPHEPANGNCDSSHRAEAPRGDARSTRERLAELDELHHDAAITDEEYASRRSAILASI